MRVAILSTTGLPGFLGPAHPDAQALFAEDDVLSGAFARLGVRAERIPWQRRDVDWADYALVLIRSTWDYIDDVGAFLRVLEEIETAGCELLNPGTTVRWNIDKRYLCTLANAGVAVVPTAVVEGTGEGAAVVAAWPPSQGGYVVKPTVGVGAFATRRCRTSSELDATLQQMSGDGPCLVQPFIDAIETEGEHSFVFGDGAFLYAAVKTPASGDFRVQVMYGAHTRATTPAPRDLRAATRCLAALPVPVHLARIDMARMADGSLALMEAELIEPQLYLFDVPGAADKVARATLERQRRGPHA